MTEWIERFMEQLGPVGVGLLIALENLIPPIPSEVILPLAGFEARNGSMHVVVVWLAATLGAVLGALILYWLGAWMGYERLHRLAGKRWFFITGQKDLDRGRKLFHRYGSWAVVLARCVPVLRSVVSVPAGLARMPIPKFVLLTAIGAGVWNAVFVGAGWHLADNWHVVETYTGPIGTAVTVAIVLGLGWLAWRKTRSS